MSRAEFLRLLRWRLAQMPQSEIEKNVAYYDEMFSDMIEDGMTEEEAAARLGDPEEIAKELLRDMPMSELVRSRVRPSGGWTAFSSAGPPQPERAVSTRPPVKSIGRSLLFSAVIDASPFLREGSARCPCSDTVHALAKRIHPEPWYLLRRGTVRLCLSGL